ncbi:MAG: hypothetical protein ABEJ28_10290 [Salinigranum sp.]
MLHRDMPPPTCPRCVDAPGEEIRSSIVESAVHTTYECTECGEQWTVVI